MSYIRVPEEELSGTGKSEIEMIQSTIFFKMAACSNQTAKQEMTYYRPSQNLWKSFRSLTTFLTSAFSLNLVLPISL